MEYEHSFAYDSSFLDRHHSPSYLTNSTPADHATVAATSDQHTKSDETKHFIMENQAQFRKDSITGSAGVLTPTSAHVKWDNRHNVHGLGIDSSTQFAPTNPFHVPHHNLGRHEAVAASNHSLGASGWPFEYHSREPTPSNSDLLRSPVDFDASHYQDSSVNDIPPPLTSFHPIQNDLGFVPVQGHTPASTNAKIDHMALAAQSMEGRPMPKRMRPSSAMRSPSDTFKPDGVRKKNTRIDIPPERSLATIERLLEQTRNEDDIKELKSQRRLLRNREAASVNPPIRSLYQLTIF